MKKPQSILSILAAVLIALVVLPFTSQPAYAVTVDAVTGSATPTLESIVALDQPLTRPTFTIDGDTAKANPGNSEVGWYVKLSDDTWHMAASNFIPNASDPLPIGIPIALAVVALGTIIGLLIYRHKNM